MISHFKRILKKTLKFFLKRKSRDINSVQYWLNRYFRNTHSFIVQIGSNDGVTGDPIYHLARSRFRSKVLLVEPVPYLFEKLKQNYPDRRRFIFENVAINDGSKQQFYYVRKEVVNELEHLPVWYDQLGSFYKENIIKHLNGVLTPHIEEITIEGITLEELFKKNEVKALDLLHIDTEGYDWKILSQLNLNIIKPTIILFEHKHLQETERKRAISFLEQEYEIFQFAGDYLCIRKAKMKNKDVKLLENRKINKSVAVLKNLV